MILHEDTFMRFFKPIANSHSSTIYNGHGFCNLEEALAHSPAGLNHVWTLWTDHDSRNQYIAAGVHQVNQESFLVTEVSHQDCPVDFLVRWNSTSLTSVGIKRQIIKLLKHWPVLRNTDAIMI